MNSASTDPTKVSHLDWHTRDPQSATLLGKALMRRGHVVWRQNRREWTVLDPVLTGVHWTVTRTPESGHDKGPWELLHCTCTPEERKEDPCVHKAAVVAHATQPCEFTFYVEGF